MIHVENEYEHNLYEQPIHSHIYQYHDHFLTWNEIKTLHLKLIPFKTTSRLATAQGSTLTNNGKSNFSLFPLEQWNRTNL